jgi:hypothetical protein
VRPGLQELQHDRCFYCDDALARSPRLAPHVDHFIPWSRYPNDAIENLVVAHERCNGQKRDFLAAADHVARWMERLAGDGSLTHSCEPSPSTRAGTTRRTGASASHAASTCDCPATCRSG